MLSLSLSLCLQALRKGCVKRARRVFVTNQIRKNLNLCEERDHRCCCHHHNRHTPPSKLIPGREARILTSLSVLLLPFFFFMDDFRKAYKEAHPDSRDVKVVNMTFLSWHHSLALLGVLIYDC